jgi:hypothetical protein
MGRYGAWVNMSFNESKSKEGKGEVKKKKYKPLDNRSSVANGTIHHIR